MVLKKWRAKVPNEVIAAPAIAQNLVLVRSNDGRVTAFDAATGERRWFHAEEGPTLSVRGNAPIVTGPGVVFVGNDSGTLSALALQDGRPLWEQAIGVPEGRTELERMSDVDGAPVLDGTTLYATSFKNETLALEGPSGRPLWTRDHGGTGGVGVSSAVVVVSDNAGSVWGLDKSSGAAMWSQAALARRSLTGVAIQGDYAVVGDYKGYLHWLKLSDGALAARARAGRDTLLAQPQVVDGIFAGTKTPTAISPPSGWHNKDFAMLPLVALVGRPNVGKSTIFNALTRTRDALVHDQPGVTRDRNYGVCRLDEQQPFIVVDTGGIAGDEDGLAGATARQARAAAGEADLVLFVVDGREGESSLDDEILAWLRKLARPTVLVINKIDGTDEETVRSEFARYGFFRRGGIVCRPSARYR